MLNKSIDQLRAFLTRHKSIILWLVVAYPAFKLMQNGIRKFDPEGMWTAAFHNWGYPIWFRIFIGILETLGGFLVLIPAVRHLGGIILFCVMVGALITRIVNGTGLDDALYISFFALIFLYLVAYHNRNSDGT